MPYTPANKSNKIICGSCGYDLTGSPRGPCPECGKTHPVLDNPRPSIGPSILRTIIGFAVVGGLYGYLNFRSQSPTASAYAELWLVIPGLLGLLQAGAIALDFGLWIDSRNNDDGIGPDAIWIWVAFEAVIALIVFALALRR